MAMPVEDLLLEMLDLLGQRTELSHNASQGRLRMNSHGILSLLHQRQQWVDAGRTFGLYDPILAKVRAQCVNQHSPLPDQQIAGLVQHQSCPLLFRLHRHDPHSWSGYCFADRLSISGISLAAIHIRLHVGWRHQPDLMA